VAAVGVSGTYEVGERQMTFTEPAHVGVTGQHLGARPLLTLIRYPVARGSSGSWPAGGLFPLLMFAPGFQQCSDTYEHLLQSWASAGYVVASVDFPRTDCLVRSAAYEPDLVNQPGDVSFALSRLLALSAQPHDFFSGRLNPHEIAAAGQSDGGDTVAALAANTCCQDHRIKAVAVLSGAEWPPMPGPYFARGAPPMLFVQGNADTINPPWTSVQLYRADRAAARYYLDLYGADHMVPYTGDNPVERLVARITLAFFDRYVLGHAGALATMTQAASGSGGLAALGSGGQLPPDTG
jgi:predicted dienelactone hydrolase